MKILFHKATEVNKTSTCLVGLYFVKLFAGFIHIAVFDFYFE